MNSIALLEEKGQGQVEYALILVLVVIVVFAVVMVLGPVVGNVFGERQPFFPYIRRNF